MSKSECHARRNRRAVRFASIACLMIAMAVHPWTLWSVGLLMYTQPVPKSGFWMLSCMAGVLGLLLAAVGRFPRAAPAALAWGAGCLAFVVAEAGMRIRPPVEVTGASRIPFVQFNSNHTWDAEPRYDAKTRILVLGDSITHGVGDFLDRTNRYHDLIETELVREGFDVDIQSVAESGWALDRYLREYRRFAPSYRPQIVLIGWCMNDINYGEAAARVEGNAEVGNRPFLQAIRWNLGQGVRAVRLNESFLCTLAVKRGSMLLKRLGFTDADWLDKHQTTYHQRLRDLWTNPELLNQIRSDFVELRDDCNRNHRRLLVAIFPFSFQLEGDASAIAALKRILDELRIERVDLVDAIRAGGGKSLYSYRDECHLNREGHRVVAKALGPTIRKGVVDGLNAMDSHSR